VAVRNDFGNHPPFVRGTRWEGLRIEQESFRSSRSRAITPGGKDPSPGTTPAATWLTS
jgi:hypothetical protein